MKLYTFVLRYIPQRFVYPENQKDMIEKIIKFLINLLLYTSENKDIFLIKDIRDIKTYIQFNILILDIFYLVYIIKNTVENKQIINPIIRYG